jgi:pyruvate dehydrogenase E2 component (dihydrolipoamide acetyltransferase)/2-oxoglutarate dehydrogenase E2 component (dihydrolipoamide succinyltransferase)
VTVAARGLEAGETRLSDPDRAGLTELTHDEAAGAPDLAVVDLSTSRLTGYRPGGGAATLTVTAEGTDGLALTLSFDEAVLPLETAAHILDDIAGRIDDPIRHIL